MKVGISSFKVKEFLKKHKDFLAIYKVTVKNRKTLKTKVFELSEDELKEIKGGEAWKEMQKPKQKRYTTPTR